MNQTLPSDVAANAANASVLLNGDAAAATFLDQGAEANTTIGIGEPDPFFSDNSFSGQEFGWGGYFQALAAVFLLLGLLYFLVHLLRRVSGKGGLRLLKRGELQLEGQMALGPKRSIVVVRFLNKRLVLGVTETQINLLESMEASHDEDKETFTQVLDTTRNSDGGD